MKYSRILTVFLALTLFLIVLHPAIVLANASELPQNVSEQIQRHSEAFDPDAIGKRMEQKATELQVVVVGGSKLYIVFALVVFAVLLFCGLFSKRILSAAFIFLGVAFMGFLVLNYWQQIYEFIMSFIDWIFGEGEYEPASGL